jgi:hypothetical protein
MAKSQKRSNREIRKPKSDKNKQAAALGPLANSGVVAGLEHIKSKRAS